MRIIGIFKLNGQNNFSTKLPEKEKINASKFKENATASKIIKLGKLFDKTDINKQTIIDLP